MFVSLPKALGVFGSVISVGGIGTGAVYATTQKTISDSMGEHRIVDKEKNETVWKKLKDRLDWKETKKPEVKIKTFSDLKGDQKKQEDLRGVCQGIGNNIYWTIFSKDESLMEDVKNFCSITIEEILDSKIDIKEETSNANKSDFEENIKKLEKYEVKEGVSPLHKSLDELHKKVKNQSKPEEFWLDLVKWCSKSYKSYFFNKDDVLWKNVETYCKKKG